MELLVRECLRYYFNAHGARGSLDALDGCLNRGRIQIGHLLRGDFADLLFSYLADFFLVRRAGAFGNSSGLLQEYGGRRRFGDEAETAVGVDGNYDWNNQPFHLFGGGARVELLAELHDVDLGLTERRTHRWRRRCFAGNNLQLHVTRNFLWRCHDSIPLQPAVSS